MSEIIYCPLHPEMVVDSPTYGRVKCPRCASAERARRFNRDDLAARFMLALLQGRSGDTLFDMATIESARSLGVESASMLAVELADALISRLDKGKPE